MAILSDPHWESVTPGLHRALNEVGNLPFSQRFYLAGGTGLSLLLGHRRSVDLDFFSESDELDENSRTEIINGLSGHTIQIIEATTGNLLMLVEGIRTGFFSYGYPLVSETVHIENVRVASIVDIGLMKCDALISRGRRKDFYDLFFIAREIDLEALFAFGQEKYALYRDFPLLVLEHMLIFDYADRDVQPDLFEDIPWEDVKQFFIRQARQISTRWFE